MPIFSDSLHALQRCAGIIGSKPHAGGRTSLLSTWLRLNAGGLLLPRFAPRPFYDERVLGSKVRAFHYRSLAILFEEIFLDEAYYFKTSARRPLIIDCGANIGLATLYFKTLYPAARVLAFEPDPGTFELLKENVRANRLEGVTEINKALYDAEGSTELHYDPAGSGSLLMSLYGTLQGSRRVETVMLSRYIDEPVDLLKMDIEGAEDAVLRDLSAQGKMALIRQLIVEYHHQLPGKQDGLAEFLGILSRNGFSYEIGGGTTPGPRKSGPQYFIIHARRKEDRSAESAEGAPITAAL
jgi:FkbM family methyltransferase